MHINDLCVLPFVDVEAEEHNNHVVIARMIRVWIWLHEEFVDMASPILCECAHVFNLWWQLLGLIKYPLQVVYLICVAIALDLQT